MLRALTPALLSMTLAGCDAGNGLAAAAMRASGPLPNGSDSAPAIANMNCVGAGAKAFHRPWQSIVLGSSRRTLTGDFKVQLASGPGAEGTQAICTVTREGKVLAIERS